MKIIVLRGGARPRRRPAPWSASSRPGTRDRGAMALGSGDGHWVLLNVSAAAAHQLDTDTLLDVHTGLHDATSRAVVLTDAQVDHVGGLLSLRDGPPIDLYATPAVFEALTTALPVLPVLQHYCGVHWHVVPVAGDTREASFRIDSLPKLEFTAIATNAPSLPHAAPGEHPRVGDSIVLAVRDLATGQRVFCAPGSAPSSGLAFDWMREADCLLMDGPDGSADDDAVWMDRLGELPARHKVLFTTDLGTAGPAQRQAMADRGIRMAYDGMEIVL
ncbi:MAG: pyrroloquinoline quinone biosynthesis protein B [Ideonella sp.]|jgi:pyrroloquinoline quinone biosynthesis protein B|nr:pyrroloquinoline quinone biosynthesis protein B [Ideonella sp.]